MLCSSHRALITNPMLCLCYAMLCSSHRALITNPIVPGGPRRSQEVQGGPRRPRRPQEAPGGSRKPQEAPGGPRRPQEAPGDPRRPQETPGDPRRPQRRPQEAPQARQHLFYSGFGTHTPRRIYLTLFYSVCSLRGARAAHNHSRGAAGLLVRRSKHVFYSMFLLPALCFIVFYRSEGA